MTVARLVALGFVTVMVQIVIAGQLRPFGATADVVVLVVAAVALVCGPVTGAGFGFGLGLFLDLSLVQTVGLSSLLYVALGYAIGRTSELRTESAFTAIGVGAGAALLAGIGYALLQFLIGVQTPVSFELVRQIITTALVSAIIATPVFAVVRRVLVSGLSDDARRRRGGRATTTKLSPLQRA